MKTRQQHRSQSLLKFADIENFDKMKTQCRFTLNPLIMLILLYFGLKNVGVTEPNKCLRLA